MKLKIFAIFFLSCVLFACKDNNNPQPPGKESVTIVGDSRVELTPEAQQVQLEFEASGDWTLTVEPTVSAMPQPEGWVVPDKLSGASGKHIVNISVAENLTYVERAAKILIGSGKSTAEFSISQSGAVEDYKLSVNFSKLNFSPEGGKVMAKVFGSKDFTLSEAPEWLKCTVEGGQDCANLWIEVEANAGDSKRECELTINYPSGRPARTLAITQGRSDNDRTESTEGKAHTYCALKFTATWCRYCTSMTEAFSHLPSNWRPLEVINIHANDSDLVFDQNKELASQYNISGLPTAVLDDMFRVENCEDSETTMLALNNAFNIIYSMGLETIPLTVKTKISNGLLGVNIGCKLAPNSYRMRAWIVEDNIVCPQLLPSGTYDADYVHQGVLRYAISDVQGDEFMVVGSEAQYYEMKYSWLIPAQSYTDNLRLIVTILPLRQSDGQTLYYASNTVSVKLGTPSQTGGNENLVEDEDLSFE